MYFSAAPRSHLTSGSQSGARYVVRPEPCHTVAKNTMPGHRCDQDVRSAICSQDNGRGNTVLQCTMNVVGRRGESRRGHVGGLISQARRPHFEFWGLSTRGPCPDQARYSSTTGPDRHRGSRPAQGRGVGAQPGREHRGLEGPRAAAVHHSACRWVPRRVQRRSDISASGVGVRSSAPRQRKLRGSCPFDRRRVQSPLGPL
ncbi:hypothetical protein NDU88_004764 [Pleurodeles waltl]|uniref:Uncharacterized protein n=1 Tax=Pleurodeles waltl TaxID=8319 RepID=A0AAV7UG97_PLEWA|nr:hypothetical protein NDU88_004764 [Pleurodeles waltl]